MPRNEDGEFELVLGNGQLFSIFAILVVLLGIFFSMGYMVGRSGASSPPIAAEAARPAPEPAKPMAAGPDSGSAPAKTTPAPAVKEPVETSREAPPDTLAATSDSAGSSVAATAPASGETFLQVVATTRPDAEMIAVTLGKDNLPARLAPGPNGLFRVIVGPTKDAADVARLRTALEGKGFHPIVRKY